MWQKTSLTNSSISYVKNIILFVSLIKISKTYFLYITKYTYVYYVLFQKPTKCLNRKYMSNFNNNHAQQRNRQLLIPPFAVIS